MYPQGLQVVWNPFWNGRRLLPPDVFWSQRGVVPDTVKSKKKRSPSHILTLRSKVLQRQGGWQVVIMMMGESQVRFGYLHVPFLLNWVTSKTLPKGRVRVDERHGLPRSWWGVDHPVHRLIRVTNGKHCLRSTNTWYLPNSIACCKCITFRSASANKTDPGLTKAGWPCVRPLRRCSWMLTWHG